MPPSWIFRALTDQLGVAGFRINQLELAPGAEGVEHDQIENGQEEVSRSSRAATFCGQAEKRFRCAPATSFSSCRMCADR